MPCGNYGNYSVLSQAFQIADVVPGTPSEDFSRILIVSNAPETLQVISNPGPGQYTLPDVATLYKCWVPLAAGIPRPFRIFMWHVNPSDDRQYHVVMSVTGTISAKVANIKTENPTQPSGSAGICIAKSQLYGGMSSASPDSVEIGDKEKSIWSISKDAGEGASALVEFTVKPDAACYVLIRIVATNDPGEIGEWSDTPVSATNPDGGATHVRGWWLKSRISMVGNSTVLDTNPDLPTFPEYIDTSVCLSYGPERTSDEGFAPQSVILDPYQTEDGNTGTYGANCEYIFTVTNTSPFSGGACTVQVIPRGGQYLGASRIVTPTLFPSKGVPVLVPGTSERDYCQLTEFQSFGLNPGETKTLTVAVANGGSAALPMQIRLLKGTVT